MKSQILDSNSNLNPRLWDKEIREGDYLQKQEIDAGKYMNLHYVSIYASEHHSSLKFSNLKKPLKPRLMVGEMKWVYVFLIDSYRVPNLHA